MHVDPYCMFEEPKKKKKEPKKKIYEKT